MNRENPASQPRIEPEDEFTPDDIHDGVARTGAVDPDAPMGSHFGAVSTEVSSVTSAGSNVSGEEPHGVAGEIDPRDEHTGG